MKTTTFNTQHVAKSLLLGIGFLALISLTGCTASANPTYDKTSNQLGPCPDKPNCVSTHSTDERHTIEPIPYTGSIDEAKERLLTVIGEMPRTTLITDNEGYIHVEYRSRIMRFVDDVELVFDDEAKLIHFRSASRVGHSDMGVNRQRMEEVRGRFGNSAWFFSHTVSFLEIFSIFRRKT